MFTYSFDTWRSSITNSGSNSPIETNQTMREINWWNSHSLCVIRSSQFRLKLIRSQSQHFIWNDFNVVLNLDFFNFLAIWNSLKLINDDGTYGAVVAAPTIVWFNVNLIADLHVQDVMREKKRQTEWSNRCGIAKVILVLIGKRAVQFSVGRLSCHFAPKIGIDLMRSELMQMSLHLCSAQLKTFSSRWTNETLNLNFENHKRKYANNPRHC